MNHQLVLYSRGSPVLRFPGRYRISGQKEWIVRDGVLGTAHRNREGRYVDFRPYESIRATRHGGHVMHVVPARGVPLPPLELPFRLTSRTVLRQDPDGFGEVEEVWEAQFQGVPLTKTIKRRLLLDPDANNTYRARVRKQATAEQRANAERLAQARALLTKEAVIEEMSESEIVRLGNPRRLGYGHNPVLSAIERLIVRLGLQDAVCLGFDPYRTAHEFLDDETFRKRAEEELQRRKAARKAALARGQVNSHQIFRGYLNPIEEQMAAD